MVMSAMVGFAAFDGVDAVDLLEEDDEGQLVLEGERAEGPDVAAMAAESGAVPVGSADEESDAFGAVQFPAVDRLAEGIGGERASAFVHGDAEAAFRSLQHAFLELGTRGFPEVFDFEPGVAGEALRVIRDAVAGPWQGGFTGGDDFPVHGCGEGRRGRSSGRAGKGGLGR